MNEAKPHPRVIVFSTLTCTYCNTAKKFLREKGIKFNDVLAKFVNYAGSIG